MSMSIHENAIEIGNIVLSFIYIFFFMQGKEGDLRIDTADTILEPLLSRFMFNGQTKGIWALLIFSIVSTRALSSQLRGRIL